MGTVTSEPNTTEEAAAREESDAIAHLSTVLRLMLYLGLAISLVGAVLGLIADGELPGETAGLSDIPGKVANGDAAGVLTLGILTFLVSPVIALLYMLVAFLRVREMRFVAISAVVFSIIVASFVIARFS